MPDLRYTRVRKGLPEAPAGTLVEFFDIFGIKFGNETKILLLFAKY